MKGFTSWGTISASACCMYPGMAADGRAPRRIAPASADALVGRRREAVGPDEHERGLPGEPPADVDAELDVEPPVAERSLVQHHPAARQVGGSGPGPAQGLQVDAVGDEVHGPVAAPARRQRRRADHDLGGRLQHQGVVASLPLHRAVRLVGEEPVVGDVVHARPARHRRELGVGVVVDPEDRAHQSEPPGRGPDLTSEGGVDVRAQPAREPLARCQCPEPSGRPDRVGPGAGLRPLAVDEGPGHVGGHADEQQPDRGPQGQELGGEELVAAPDVVPRFEGAADDVGRRHGHLRAAVGAGAGSSPR